MRYVVWLLLIFALAVLAAVTLGRNDGVVAIAWRSWRVDLSLNLFLACMVASCVLLVMAIQGVDSLLSLPRRAREWRLLRRDRAAQSALREAWAEHFAARYRRAQKAAQRSAGILDETPELDRDGHTRKLAHLLSAASAHQLQDRSQRDRHLQVLRDWKGGGKAASSAAEEGASLLAVEWALDDRDASLALQRLDALPPGVARRTQALRLRLRAHRLEGHPLEALQTARLLAKHQAFTPNAAQGLIRSLAISALDEARDADQLRKAWLRMESSERLDPYVAAHGAQSMAKHGDPATARAWLEPVWSALPKLGVDERAAVAQALVVTVEAAPQDAALEGDAAWLARVEEAARMHGQDPSIALAAGSTYAQRQLWGKARAALEQAARAPTLAPPWRRRAWRRLAALARALGDETRAQHCEHEATVLEDA